METTETRNSKILADFIAYCTQHPDQRFWQALCNWSGYDRVLGDILTPGDARSIDTFYLESKRER